MAPSGRLERPVLELAFFEVSQRLTQWTAKRPSIGKPWQQLRTNRVPTLQPLDALVMTAVVLMDLLRPLRKVPGCSLRNTGR